MKRSDHENAILGCLVGVVIGSLFWIGTIFLAILIFNAL